VGSTWLLNLDGLKTAMLLPGVFIDAITNLSAEHGHGELKEITVADLGCWCPEEVTADLFLPNQEGHLWPEQAVAEPRLQPAHDSFGALSVYSR
jgi:hypothetical protein